MFSYLVRPMLLLIAVLFLAGCAAPLTYAEVQATAQVTGC